MASDERHDLPRKLLEATQEGNFEEVSRLLNAKADPNTQDEAAAVGNSEIVSLLLLSSANPNQTSQHDMVARQLAADRTTQVILDLFSGVREVDPQEKEAAVSTLSTPLQLRVLEHTSQVVASSSVVGEEQPSKLEEQPEPQSVLETEQCSGEANVEGPEPAASADPSPVAAEVQLPDGMAETAGEVPEAKELQEEPTVETTSAAEAEPAAPGVEKEEDKQESSTVLAGPGDSSDSGPLVAEPSKPDEVLNEADPKVPDGETPSKPAEGPEEDLSKEPGSEEPVQRSSPHVIEHSPLVAVRSQPWMQSAVIGHLRPGQKANLGEWDATQQWRRIVSIEMEPGSNQAAQEGWLPVWHPTLGSLVRLTGAEAFPPKRDFDRQLPGPSVAEVWQELYSNGCLDIPPPERTESGGTLAAKALMEVMTLGRAQTPEGEMALASLDPATVEHVMKAAIQHLRDIGRPLD